MRIFLLNILFILFTTSFVFSQQWILFEEDSLHPLNPSIEGFYSDDSLLYISGGFIYGGNIQLWGAGIWNTMQWDSLDEGISNGGRCVTKYKDKIYYGGSFTDASGVSNTQDIARWNGISWESLPNSYGNMSSVVRDLVVYKDTLIIAANSPAGTATRIAAYDADINDYIDIGSLPFNSTLALAVYNGELYAGGSWDVLKKYIGGIGLAAWEDVGGNLSYFIKDMEVDTFNNFLYVAGGFIVVDDSIITDNVAIWNGFYWEKVGYGNAYQSDVEAIEIYNGDLYAGIYWDTIGGVYTKCLARWDETDWHMVGGGVKYTVYALEEFQDKLYVGGNFDTVGGQPQKGIACWLDTTPNCRHLKPRVFSDTTTYYLVNDTAQVQFYNNNAYVDTWSWDFGDTGTSTIKDPSHIYTDTGTYSVEVIVTHGTCVDTASKTIVVDYPVNVGKLIKKEIGFKLYPNPSDGNFYAETNIRLTPVSSREIGTGSKGEQITPVLKITDLKGNLISTIPINSNKTTINTNGWSKGVYICNLLVNGKVLKSEKIILE